MSQQVRIERELKFAGAADYLDNIFGNLSFNKHVLYDDFDGPAVDETNNWAVNESHGGTATISVAKNGMYRLAASTTDDDKAELARELVWYSSLAAVVECRIKVDVITNVKLNVGFSDAKSEADNLTAFNINGTTMEATATNAVCWVFDTDGTSDYWYIGNVKAGTAAGTSIAIAPVAATYETFRIALDTSGNATYWRNGVVKGYKALAVTTTTALTPYIAVQALGNTGVARNLDVDYVKCWQDRGANS